jgi:hypothetical protein
LLPDLIKNKLLFSVAKEKQNERSGFVANGVVGMVSELRVVNLFYLHNASPVRPHLRVGDKKNKKRLVSRK